MRLNGAQVGGVVLVVLGILFLLANAGIIALDWRAVGPLVLVLVGILIVLAALAPRSDRPSSVRLPRGPGELEVDLTAGAGRFRLAGGANGVFELDSLAEDIRWTADQAGGRGRVRVRQDAGWVPWRHGTDWTIRLASDVPAALDLTVGAGELDLDLLDVRLVGARLSLGAASGSMRLPRPVGDVRIDVSLGAASLRVGVPSGVEARVQTSGGLMSVNGQPETPGWAAATDRVTVNVSGGASSVRVVPA